MKTYFVSIFEPPLTERHVATFHVHWLAKLFVLVIRPFVRRDRFIMVKQPAWIGAKELIDYAEKLLFYSVQIPRRVMDQSQQPGVGTSGAIFNKTILSKDGKEPN